MWLKILSGVVHFVCMTITYGLVNWLVLVGVSGKPFGILRGFLFLNCAAILLVLSSVNLKARGLSWMYMSPVGYTNCAS